ncbi:MAG: hypothetical protein EYC70_11290 [Planctomycetota bacterium]|nr:MAG: hypothetical protein EYC70_11290 [Planctomycetota bacterium]
MKHSLFLALPLAAALSAAALSAQSPGDPDRVQPGSGAVAPSSLLRNAATCLTVDATGADNFTTADYHGVTNNDCMAVASLSISLANDSDAFWDFDGGSTFGNATAPVIGAIGGMNAADVTWSYDALYPHPVVLTATFNPPMAPGAFFRFGADTDFFVSDPCAGGNFGAAPATITATFVNGRVRTHNYVTQSATSSTAEASGAGLSLTLAGACPGTIGVTISGAGPGNNVALLYAFGMGSVRVPAGRPCAGTLLCLDPPVTLLAVLTANAGGMAAASGNAPAAACGNVFVQAIDLGTCEISNVAGL